jgi:hypothetical protein
MIGAVRGMGAFCRADPKGTGAGAEAARAGPQGAAKASAIVAIAVARPARAVLYDRVIYHLRWIDKFGRFIRRAPDVYPRKRGG